MSSVLYRGPEREGRDEDEKVIEEAEWALGHTASNNGIDSFDTITVSGSPPEIC